MWAVTVALAWRCDVVPLASVLVVCHEDQGVAGPLAVLDGADEVDQVPLAVRRAGVAGVLVLGAVRLDEAHGREGAGLGSREEVLLILQMRTSGLALPIGGEVRERLVVVLEVRARAVRVDGGRAVCRVLAGARSVAVGPATATHVAGRVVPAAGVPRPRDISGTEFVADVRGGGVVDRGEPARVEDSWCVWLVERLDGVHGDVAACAATSLTGEVGGDGTRLCERAVSAVRVAVERAAVGVTVCVEHGVRRRGGRP